MNVMRLVLAASLTVFAGVALAAAPVPKRHAAFAHYTFALTWQPGFCSGPEPCLDSTSRTTLIGLHGLWASRPQSLIRARIAAPQWWQRGCDFFHHSDAAPALSHETLAQLQEVMPQLQHDLLTHEYDKHVQCFGFDAQDFFDTALAMRVRVVDSAFGRYLLQRARGETVERSAVVDAFVQAFGTDQRNALQLRCETQPGGRAVLSQLWITLHADKLAAFPRKASLMNAPIAQDNCPASFLVPTWNDG